MPFSPSNRRGPARDTRLRPLGSPALLAVRADRNGTPLRIRTSGRGASVPPGWASVTSIQESWRIDDEWWRTPISRLYHRVVLENGKVTTIYRDLVDGGWYAHERR